MSSEIKPGAIGNVVPAMTNAEIGASLATITLSGYGTEYNNSNNYTNAFLNVTLGSAAFVAGNMLELFCMNSDDLAGVGYPTLRTYAQEALASYRVATIYIPGTTAAQKMNPVEPIKLTPGKSKFFCATSGASCPALAATGNAINLYPFNYIIV